MFDLTIDDVKTVFARLKDRYDLVLTNALSVDDGFEEDCAILVGRREGYILWLYEWGGDFVLDVMDDKKTAGTHWHPNDVEQAVEDIADFFENEPKYKLHRFPKR